MNICRMSRRRATEVVTVEDVVEAERFLFESTMAVIMPQVTSGVALLSELRGTVSYTGHKYSYRLVRR